MTAAQTLYCTMDSPLGPCVATADGEAITGFYFTGQKYYPATSDMWEESSEHPAFTPLREWLKRYFAGENPGMNLALKPRGSDFQKAVWDILLAIPYGELTTYGAIARQMAGNMGLPSMSAQAVGGAVGHNPIGIIIPCHRVVGSSGKLTGYAGGLDKKEALLRLEGAYDRLNRRDSGQYGLFEAVNVHVATK